VPNINCTTSRVDGLAYAEHLKCEPLLLLLLPLLDAGGASVHTLVCCLLHGHCLLDHHFRRRGCGFLVGQTRLHSRGGRPLPVCAGRGTG